MVFGLERLDAVVDSLVSLNDGAARPLLISLHETSDSIRAQSELASELLTALILRAEGEVIQFLQAIQHSAQFTAYCIGIVTVITAVIFSYGVARIVATHRHICGDIEKISATKGEASTQTMHIQDILTFSAHVLDFAEFTASKGYKTIFVYHPGNRWHGAAHRLKSSSTIQWLLIQTDVCSLHFINNSQQLVDKMRAARLVTDNRSAENAIAVIFPAGYSSFIHNFCDIPSDLSPVHFFGQTNHIGVPFTWLPGEMKINNKPLPSQSGTIFSLGARSSKEKASNANHVEDYIFDSGGHLTTEDFDNICI